MFKTTKQYLLLILSASCLTIITFNEEAYAATAKATYQIQSDTGGATGQQGSGNYTLGTQTIYCDGVRYDEPQQSYSYAGSLRGEREVSRNESCTKNTAVNRTEVTASSTMKDVSENTNNFYNWTLEVKAEVKRQNGNSPTGIAIARGEDPQFFEAQTFPNVDFIEEITLKEGSSVFEEDEQDEAFTKFNRESTLLESPIFSIDIFGLGSSLVDAVVNFNSDSSLTFSTTALALEALLEDPLNGLGTEDGLLSDISFSYTWDLSGYSITSDDTVSGGGESYTSSVTVPEPTSSLGFLALGTLGAVSTLKPKLKSSKEKKPEKVS